MVELNSPSRKERKVVTQRAQRMQWLFSATFACCFPSRALRELPLAANSLDCKELDSQRSRRTAGMLNASTLVEALVAMVIVMLALGVFTTIYVNVIKSGDRQRKVQAGLLLDKIANETKQEHLFLDAEFKTEEFVILKKIAPYAGSTSLFSLSLKAFDKNEKLLTVRNELVLK